MKILPFELGKNTHSVTIDRIITTLNAISGVLCENDDKKLIIRVQYPITDDEIVELGALIGEIQAYQYFKY